MDINNIPKPTVKRLSLYLRQLRLLQNNKVKTISSRELAHLLDITDAQVRKDLAYFGAFGKRGLGYHVNELTWNLTDILQLNKKRKVIIFGAGNLGHALAQNKEFAKKGFIISSVFDTDPNKIGQLCGKLKIEPLSNLKNCVTRDNILIAIIAVPEDTAQKALDIAVNSGIRCILNFAPAKLIVPPGVQIRSIDLSIELEQLSFGMA